MIARWRRFARESISLAAKKEGHRRRPPNQSHPLNPPIPSSFQRLLVRLEIKLPFLLRSGSPHQYSATLRQSSRLFRPQALSRYSGHTRLKQIIQNIGHKRPAMMHLASQVQRNDFFSATWHRQRLFFLHARNKIQPSKHSGRQSTAALSPSTGRMASTKPLGTSIGIVLVFLHDATPL